MPIKKLTTNKYRIEDGITQSMICDFLSCRQKLRLKIDRWESIYSKTSSLERGNFIHYFLEHIYASSSDYTVTDMFYNWCRLEGIDEASKDAISILGICEALLPQYVKHWTKSDTKYKWISLERVFDVTWMGYRLRGKIDGILIVNGTYYIFETKTKAQIEEEGVLDKLQFDFQNFFYLLVCRSILNLPVRGVIYNIIRWPNSRLKQSLVDHINADSAHYFKRFEVVYSNDDITAFERELLLILKDYSGWVAGEVSHYKNASNCFKGNMKCEFLKICSSGQFAGFNQTRTLFRELI